MKSLVNIAILLICTTPLQIGIGLFLANALNKKLLKKKVFRIAYYLTVITSSVAIAFLFDQFLAFYLYSTLTLV